MTDLASRSVLARKIKAAREHQRWTQADLARRAHVSRSWVAAVESGTQETPRLDFLRRAAEVLDLDLAGLMTDDLFEGVGPDRSGDVALIHRKLDRLQRASATILDGLAIYAGILQDHLPLSEDQRRALRDVFSEEGDGDAEPPRVQ